ncbi:NAD(P)/FAD-dependent oxidoreductase [Paraburkholderia hospita]|uniref:NAD(P)/FAD-dependent oxidoreductase n=1 Tax=Paraburkholderia hospita TaxID=169430 RepID=UPI000DEF407D|nr:FAD-dependent oxidoreductase [Paraburkholderia hospita]AXF05892.1 pyridine nucleotide-disulfide oxidoreductase [Paraburkholderia hospita]
MESIVIVGAGHSGGKAAQALRKHGFAGKIALVGSEAHPPYDRPPLSKAVLLGKKPTEACFFKPVQWYEENGIDLFLGRTVERIDRPEKLICLDDGQELRYGRLLLATGARPNELRVPGGKLDGVSQLRTTLDAALILPWLSKGRHLIVVGAGFIGLEVAAAASELGCAVTVLEAAPSALMRSLPERITHLLIDTHKEHGVDVRFGVHVASIEGNGKVSAVGLTNREVLPCDAVVYGIGVTPNTALAEEAGLTVRNGILVGPDLRTTDDDIFACGDACVFWSPLYQREIRLESWKNAEDQADVAARGLMGESVAYSPVPWFWSNQYDVSLQVAGMPTLGANIVERPIGGGRLFFSLAHNGELVGVSAPLRHTRCRL